MQTHIQKWGNSLGLRLPLQMVKQLNLSQGSLVSIEIENDCIVIKSPKYDLDSMLDKITINNRHHEIFDDHSQGQEEW